MLFLILVTWWMWEQSGDWKGRKGWCNHRAGESLTTFQTAVEIIYDNIMLQINLYLIINPQ